MGQVRTIMAPLSSSPSSMVSQPVDAVPDASVSDCLNA